MKTVNSKIREAVETAVVSGTTGHKKFGNCRVVWDENNAKVSYCGNVVFDFDKKNKSWTLDNCGWCTAMTREKTEACMEAIDLPYRYFIRKREQWMRNIDTGREWKCGDGPITQTDVECAGIA